MDVRRCAWANRNEFLSRYHDEEWGFPQHEDSILFGQLALVVFQAGLSWTLLLKKRPAMRLALADFDPTVIADFDDGYMEGLLLNDAIIRNGAKLRALRGNARCFLRLQTEYGSFSSFLWRYAPPLPEGCRAHPSLSLTVSPESQVLSLALREHGFKFVGPTTCHSYMESVGMLGNPHEPCCFLG